MSLQILTQETLTVGQPLIVDCESPIGRFAVVFEDDGETGYFYAVDTHAEEGNPVQDALQIYEVTQVADADRPSALEIGWSADGLKALLLINDDPHAVFDFERRQGWCLLGLPVPAADADWSASGHGWSDTVEAIFE